MKHSPKNKTAVTPRVARRLSCSRLRNAELRQRIRDAKENHGDQLRFPRPPLLESEIQELVDEFYIYLATVKAGAPIKADFDEIEKATTSVWENGKPMSNRDWDKMVGLLIARAVRRRRK